MIRASNAQRKWLRGGPIQFEKSRREGGDPRFRLRRRSDDFVGPRQRGRHLPTLDKRPSCHLVHGFRTSDVESSRKDGEMESFQISEGDRLMRGSAAEMRVTKCLANR